MDLIKFFPPYFYATANLALLLTCNTAVDFSVVVVSSAEVPIELKYVLILK